MSLKKTDRMIDELADRLFIVEGEITDLLTSETMQNLNANMQTATGVTTVDSALIRQIGTATLVSFATSDEYIEDSDFALELTDKNNQQYYFVGCFPEVIFKTGDTVKVIAEELHGEKKYARVNTIIDHKNNYMWTGQEVVKGRLRHRVYGMKILGGTYLFILIVQFIFNYFNFHSIGEMLNAKSGIQINILVVMFICLFIGWRIGVSFDVQSIELEAILKKLDFNKPSMASLNDFSVFSVNRKNKIKMNEYPDRWEQYTYRLDLAKQYDEEKYGKK
ncbi:hypothetical protein KTJ16_07085 [Acinetobacter bereziniae]|uniref:putative type VI secretion system effector n=1 Tax=Acinetobacter bereziniae TaxID=106648 RepID=UPI0021CD89A4|nr:putative type VI secretion system effector [Acinetobacter bereziniae]MCU4540936.1 hypothetical protein [Acinetobacter bereziniae]MCU4625999.1 hypothetical protein [Acinetobacter bereziniae]